MKYLGIFCVWIVSLVAVAQCAIYDTKEVMEQEMNQRLSEKCPAPEPAPEGLTDAEVLGDLRACINGLESCAADLNKVVSYMDACECNIEPASFH